MAITVTALPVDFNFLALLLIIFASVVFLLSPAMLESPLVRRYARRPAYESGEDEDIASPPVS